MKLLLLYAIAWLGLVAFLGVGWLLTWVPLNASKDES